MLVDVFVGLGDAVVGVVGGGVVGDGVVGDGGGVVGGGVVGDGGGVVGVPMGVGVSRGVPVGVIW